MSRRFTIPTIAGLAATGIAMTLLMTSAGHAADKQISTAATHAKLAAAAPSVDGVRSHLHHALNCLEGPKGADFDAKEMNPCDGMGKGAIPDAADKSVKASLETAATKAKAGIAAGDVDGARQNAKDTEAALNAIK